MTPDEYCQEKAAASGTVACVNVLLDPDAPAASGSQGYAV